MAQLGLNLQHFITLWNESEEVRNQIKILLDGQNLVMFFKKGDSIYGCPEEGRITYAIMKNPDNETSDKWVNDANFMAMNLNKALMGAKVYNIFSNKDVKEIKVLDKSKVEDSLVDLATALGKELKAEKISPKPDQPSNTPTSKSDVPLGEK